MKLHARQPEAKHQEAVTRLTPAVLTPEIRHRSAGDQAHLERPQRALRIGRRDSAGGFRIQRGQARANRGRVGLPLGLQDRPQPGVAGGLRKEPVEEGPNVEVRPAHHHREAAPGADPIDCLVRVTDEHPGRVALAGIHDVDEVVRDARAGLEIRLRSSNVETTVDGERIRRHDFPG
jgi:hypothetical protein